MATGGKEASAVTEVSPKNEEQDFEDPGVVLSEFCSNLDDYTPTVSISFVWYAGVCIKYYCNYNAARH